MTRQACPTMGKFYDRVGALLRQHTISSGVFPFVTHTAIFEYENGEATWDGRRWTWLLDVEAVPT